MSRFLFLIFWISAVVCSGNAEEPQDDDTPGLELVGTNIAALGEVTLLDRPQSVFVLTNRTDQTLAIRSLRRTCACITASVDTMSVPPGGSARITMVLDLTGIQGSFKRALWVTLADSDRKRILLQQAGTVLPLFNGLPDGEVALSAPDLATACWTNTFILTPTDPRLRLGTPLFAATNSALRQTATLVTNAAPQGTYTLTVVLQALTNAHAETRLLLPVTGAENRKDQLLLKLNAKVGQRLTARPDRLYLRESPVRPSTVSCCGPIPSRPILRC